MRLARRGFGHRGIAAGLVTLLIGATSALGLLVVDRHSFSPGCDGGVQVNASAIGHGGALDYEALTNEVNAATKDRTAQYAGEYDSGNELFIGFTGDVDGARAEIKRKVRESNLVHVYQADYPLSLLTSTYLTLSDRMSSLPPSIQITEVGVDIVRDQVIVALSKPRTDWEASLRAQYGCLLIFEVVATPGVAT
jgi:hypothetical protein